MPAPGHPFGVAVDKDRVYISTSAGDFFTDPPNGGHLFLLGERKMMQRSGPREPGPVPPEPGKTDPIPPEMPADDPTPEDMPTPVPHPTGPPAPVA